MPFTLVIHGGAGNITPAIMNEQDEKDYSAGLQTALDAGYAVLEKGGTAMDAVVTAITELENNPRYMPAELKLNSPLPLASTAISPPSPPIFTSLSFITVSQACCKFIPLYSIRQLMSCDTTALRNGSPWPVQLMAQVLLLA